MANPKVSIIMSAYNAMPYLKNALLSILNQTFSDFEFIIINDASTDKTALFLKTIKDSRVKIIENKKNLGLAASLNLGLKKAKGTYIARMDADDISLPERLKIQLDFLSKNKSIDICGSYAKLIDEKGEDIGLVKKPVSDKDIKKLNRWMTGIIHPTWFAKKEIYEKLKGYSEEWDYVEDMEFLLRAKKFKMANIPKVLLLWRSPVKRRSNKNIEKIYKESLKLRISYFLKGEFGLSYLPYIIRSIISTYLIPANVKVYLNKKAGLV